MSEVADAAARVEVPVTPRVPATPRLYPGVVEPIPSLPLAARVRRLRPDDDAIERRLLLPASPVIDSAADGVVDPTPKRPFEPKKNI